MGGGVIGHGSLHMTMSYYDNGKRPQSYTARVLMLANGLTSIAVLLYWSGVSLFMEEPVRWATRAGMSASPPIFEYPYLLLWLLPFASMCGAWVALKADYPALARFMGLYPLLFLLLMVGWYYGTPPHWH